MTIRTLRALWALMLALVLAPAEAWTEDAVNDPIAARAEKAMWYGDFDVLDQLYADARKRPLTELNAWNGRHAVQSVRSGLSAVFKYGNLNGSYFRELERLTEGWARSRPDSVLAQLVYVRAVYAHAWHIRGGGYWQGVPAPAKAEFVRLIAKAEKHVGERSKLLMDDSTTHLYLLLIGRSAGWSFEQMEAVAEDSLRRSFADEDAIYEDLVTQLLPKWGGEWRDVVRFIERVDARTKERRGHEVYALLWSEVANNYEGNIFEGLKADWPRMKQGWERLAGKFSHPYFLNRLAYFACTARALPAARAALEQLGSKADAAIWQGGGAGGTQNYEACVRWVNETP